MSAQWTLMAKMDADTYNVDGVLLESGLELAQVLWQRFCAAHFLVLLVDLRWNDSQDVMARARTRWIRYK